MTNAECRSEQAPRESACRVRGEAPRTKNQAKTVDRRSPLRAASAPLPPRKGGRARRLSDPARADAGRLEPVFAGFGRYLDASRPARGASCAGRVDCGYAVRGAWRARRAPAGNRRSGLARFFQFDPLAYDVTLWTERLTPGSRRACPRSSQSSVPARPSGSTTTAALLPEHLDVEPTAYADALETSRARCARRSTVRRRR